MTTQELFNRRDKIPPGSDVLWLIQHGAVRTLTWSEEGTAITLGYWGPGEIVGYPLPQLQPYEIQCLTSAELSPLPPALWSQSVDAVVCHIQQTEKLLSIVHLNPVSLRLWQSLVWLSDRFGRDVDQGRLINLPLTQQEIAEAIATTRATVTRLLQQYKSEGRLLQHKRQLIICGNTDS